MMCGFIFRAALVDLLICFATYLLGLIDAQFTWLFIASLILLLWLCVAGICSILELLTLRDEA